MTERETENVLLFSACTQVLKRLTDITLENETCFNQFPDLNANLTQKHSQIYPEITH